MKMKFCLSLFLLLTGTYSLQAQVKKSIQAVTQPACCSSLSTGMQVSIELFTRRANPFVTSKIYNHLYQHCGRPHPVSTSSIATTDFFAILRKVPSATGLKIYFGAFSPTGNIDDKYSTGNENILVPIFVLTKQDGLIYHHDCSDYFIVDPMTKKFVKVLKESVGTWVKNFRNSIDMAIEENTSLWYDKTEVVNWKADLACKKLCYPTINEIIMYWGIYEKDLPGMVKPTKDKLTLLFYVPGIPDIHELFGGTYDTAVPCPPGANCDGDEFGG